MPSLFLPKPPSDYPEYLAGLDLPFQGPMPLIARGTLLRQAGKEVAPLIKDFIYSFPQKFWDRLKEFKYIPGELMDVRGIGTQGTYLPAFRSLLLREGVEPSKSAKFFQHETGHALEDLLKLEEVQNLQKTVESAGGKLDLAPWDPGQYYRPAYERSSENFANFVGELSPGEVKSYFGEILKRLIGK